MRGARLITVFLSCVMLPGCGGDGIDAAPVLQVLAKERIAVTERFIDDHDWFYVSFDGMPANPRAAITISKRGWPHADYHRIAFTKGDTRGELAFGPLPSSIYVARAYSTIADDGVPREADFITATEPFDIYAETRNY